MTRRQLISLNFKDLFFFFLQAYTEVPSTPLHTAAVLREEEENWQDVKVRSSLSCEEVLYLNRS